MEDESTGLDPILRHISKVNVVFQNDWICILYDDGKLQFPFLR